MLITSPSSISKYLLDVFKDLVIINSWGETSFFYNPNNLYPRGTYFCTIKESDGENDKASALDRDNTFRFNFGITKPTFLKLFNNVPKRPTKGGVINGSYDFTQIDTLCPHPVYGWMCWVAIINPSEVSFKELEDVLLESYQLVLQKHQKKHKDHLKSS
jgi:hypothetical protein